MSTFLAIIVVALAAHRAARAIAVDDISAPFRGWVNNRAWAWPTPNIEDSATVQRRSLEQAGIILQEMFEPAQVQPVRISRPWAWFYGLVSCAFCSGFWLSLIGWWVYAGWHPSRTWFVDAVAVAGAQSIFAAKGSTP